MKNKDELIEEIKTLPKYELKDVFIQKEEYIKQKRFLEVTEVNKNQGISIVTNRYKLTQFQEVFLPIVEDIGELNGEIKFYEGKGVLFIFPEGEKFCLDEKNKIGMAIFNSVTKEYAVIIDFVVLKEDCYIILPKKITALRKKHIGNIKSFIQDYEKILGKVKESWNVINEKFSREMSPEEITSILENLKFGKKVVKKLGEKFEEPVTLWEFFTEVTNIISDRKYKNEINRIEKIKEVSNIIFKYSILETLE
jgi:hypothetical protein